MELYWIVLPLVAYLLGSIPSAVWMGRMAAGIDIREHGSRNAGATNVMRVLGVKLGVTVLVVDALKGFAAVQLANFVATEFISQDALITFRIVLGAFAVLGHVFPLFARFKGGKGVATLLGIVLALHFSGTMVALGVFVVALLLSRYVSLASVCAALSFPPAVLLLFQEPLLSLRIFAVAACVLLLVTHRKNMIRLWNGTEAKAGFLFGKKD